jgi:hypothetical protein|tara:strand:- start:12 stop:203 length:192 start_codon:yes stop_codon:yes gene_type:complete
MSHKPEEIIIKHVPSVLRLIWKLIRFSKDGWNEDEKKELGEDLLEMAYYVLADVMHKPSSDED